MSRKPLTNRQKELVAGVANWPAERLEAYRDNLWKAGYDVPGMSLVSRAVRAVSSTAKTVVRFGRSAIRHLRQGLPKPSPEVIEERRAICQACPHWKNGQCGLCKCLTRAKTSWAGESCPDDPPRWEAVQHQPHPTSSLPQGSDPP